MTENQRRTDPRIIRDEYMGVKSLMSDIVRLFKHVMSAIIDEP